MKNTMRAREGKKALPANFQVCFPSNPNLTHSTPKPFCSPARPTDSAMRHHHYHQYQHPLTRCNNSNRGGQASPLWPKTRPSSLEITEPSSPKVTCAGQIKIRPKNKPRQSVMEDIEMVHHNNKKVERFGLKKDKRHFLNSLRCFGTIKESESDAITSIDDEEQKTQVSNSMEDSDQLSGASKAVVSKWFMVLQENNNNNKIMVANKEEAGDGSSDEYGCESVVPPSNALLLMRCRSAPSNKNFLVEKEEELVLDQEEKTDSLILKCYGPAADLLKVNSDLQNENRLVGGMKDPLSRSRRWRRS